MTDFNKVEQYYSIFDEWARLDMPSGKLEFELTKSIIAKHLKLGDRVLDLGGGPGRYSIEFAQLGYEMHLADLSEELLLTAKAKIEEYGAQNVKSVTRVNAIDLSVYEDGSFDVVLLMGPLYHLINETDRNKCLIEVNRVLKHGGLVIAAYIPYLSGAIGIVDRLFFAPSHVNTDNLEDVFSNGIFRNNSTRGFQEGYYPTTTELVELFSNNGFEESYVRSVRGFGFGREENIYKLKEENVELYNQMIEYINLTASDEAIIETCAHALYIGNKV